MVTNYKLGQFKLDYEEYQKLKVMFINPDFSFINIYIYSAIRSQWIIKAQNALIKFSFRASEVCSSTQFKFFAKDFAKNIS
jgi:hypothetical protein